MRQVTNALLMIRPISFRMNEQTAVNNYYQKEFDSLDSKSIQFRALNEFDAFVEKLRAAGVEVFVVQDTKDFDTPDSIFPNNWISFHQNGTVGIYPMFAENRRLERREDILELLESANFNIEQVIDYTSAESEELFLEGTGSMALDRVHKKAYCALSPRADEDLLIEFCEDFEYTPIPFVSNQTVNGNRLPIYHTNVMMCVGETFCVICLESIDDKKERKNVINHLKSDGKEIIALTEKQVNGFAGNMLQVLGAKEQVYTVMSQTAFQSLTVNQIEKIEKHSKILYSPLHTIERCGGGSARCMMAEVFLPRS